MAAILRVKRSYYDEPSNALVISCKRQKIAEDEDTEDILSVPITTLAKFAGTVKEQVCVKKRNISSYLNVILRLSQYLFYDDRMRMWNI